MEIIKLARSKNFKYVMLNTNGLRIAEDEEFVRELPSLRINLKFIFNLMDLRKKLTRY